MRKLFLDLDGLGADWAGFVLSCYPQLRDIGELNRYPKGTRDAMLINLYQEHPRLFYCLDKIDKYQALLDYAKANFKQWFILTAGTVHHPSHQQVKRDKRNWLADIFEVPKHRCIVVRDNNSKLDWVGKNSVLVDDYVPNCQQWIKHGGIAVHATAKNYDPEMVIANIEKKMKQGR